MVKKRCLTCGLINDEEKFYCINCGNGIFLSVNLTNKQFEKIRKEKQIEKDINESRNIMGKWSKKAS